MGVLDAFTSTWSNARTTFGQGTPQTGEPFDASSQLGQLGSDLSAAAPGSRWTGSASAAYDAVNTEHRRVIGELGGLDRRLRTQIDRSAQVVTAGRADLDAEYRALGDQRFAGGDQRGKDGDKPAEPQNPYEKALREAGLLDGPPPDGYYREWLENAQRQGVPPEVIVDIARRHNITPESFNVLNGMEKVTDKDGKSFFLLPKGTSGEDARKAALMTYVLNAGTDYGDSPGTKDFAETPYSADEVQRIIDRQEANSWSYDKDVGFVDSNGGRLMTTPNGMLMGLGGNQLQDLYSEAGGSTWGDIFMLNIDDPSDAAQQLKQVAESGQMWYPADDGNGSQGRLDLDRILHHEERHSQQWADKGYGTMLREYGWEIFREKVLGKTNRLEEDAGLSDGGYH